MGHNPESVFLGSSIFLLSVKLVHGFEKFREKKEVVSTLVY